MTARSLADRRRSLPPPTSHPGLAPTRLRQGGQAASEGGGKAGGGEKPGGSQVQRVKTSQPGAETEEAQACV